jgi:hypothetical protein
MLAQTRRKVRCGAASARTGTEEIGSFDALTLAVALGRGEIATFLRASFRN